MKYYITRIYKSLRDDTCPFLRKMSSEDMEDHMTDEDYDFSMEISNKLGKFLASTFKHKCMEAEDHYYWWLN